MGHSTRKTATALMFAFLLLSIQPLEARRQLEIHEAGTEAADALAELQRSESDDEYIGETWASCDQLQQDFERRAKKTEDALSAGQTKKSGSTRQLIYSALKMRIVMKTFTRAENKRCAWTTDQSVKKEPLEAIKRVVREAAPCYQQAEAKLQHAMGEEGTDTDIYDAFKMASSRTCTAPSATAGSPTTAATQPAPVSIEEQEEHVQDMIVEMDSAAEKVMEKLVDSDGTSFLELSEEEPGLATLFLVAVGIIAAAMLLAMSCQIFTFLIPFILGLISCTLQSLFDLVLGTGVDGRCDYLAINSHRNAQEFCRR